MESVRVGNTHLVRGGISAIEQVRALLEEEGISKGNPDVFARSYRQFGIDEARELRERAHSRATSLHQRIFVIAAPSMTSEAQNALLKTIEEPSQNALFYFIVPAPEALLPTLRSRSQILSLAGRGVSHRADAESFIRAEPRKRIDMLKPLLEKDDDEKRDLGEILAFLSSLERLLEKHPERLKPLYLARKYVTDKGALVKPLLEQMALLLPVV
ncbi:MAG: hypothetical protein RLZZ416_128 [Candidatus Parcubacteria bacterium]|jgi:hypothetical protein